jgi:hypothetical protein
VAARRSKAEQNHSLKRLKNEQSFKQFYEVCEGKTGAGAIKNKDNTKLNIRKYQLPGASGSCLES